MSKEQAPIAPQGNDFIMVDGTLFAIAGDKVYRYTGTPSYRWLEEVDGLPKGVERTAKGKWQF